MLRILLAALVCALCGSLHAADKNPSAFTLGVAADRADCIYRRGERVTFTISVSLKGTPISDAKVRWTLTKDGKDIGQSGEAKLTDGKATVTGKLDEPGFLQCRADITPPGEKLKTVRAGAAIDAPRIQPSRTRCWRISRMCRGELRRLHPDVRASIADDGILPLHHGLSPEALTGC